jgi:hypothetical protein
MKNDIVFELQKNANQLEELKFHELIGTQGGDWIVNCGVAVGRYWCWVKNNYGKYVVQLDNSSI